MQNLKELLADYILAPKTLSALKAGISNVRNYREKVNKKVYYSQIFLRTQFKINPDVWKIFTHTTEDERLLLYHLASKLAKNNVIVEIGSYLGASTCFLAAGCSHENGHIYAVDTWQNQTMPEGLRDTYQEFLCNTKAYYHLITPIRSLSVDAAKNFASAIDLIFVDADHSYEGVMADLNAWLPRLKPEGWLILHDWGWAEGVKQAVQEVVEPIAIDKAIMLPNLYAVRVNSKKN